MPERYFGYYQSPIGLVEVSGTSDAITSLNFVEVRRKKLSPNPIVEKALQQVTEYFLGTRREFDLRIAIQGTNFQQSVWQQLLSVPYGHTASYQNIANAVDKPRAVRAVGAANGRNPISIVVPCHRVIGSDGSLTGYGGGLWRKEWLLKHESVWV
jgi:methylated-DNA-[protein]-cysteine S-methyltransferase